MDAATALSRHALAFLDKAHLLYLALLPSWATVAILKAYGHRYPFLLFLGGIVLVSVYLAVVASYTRPAPSIGVALVALLDGPAWVVATRLAGRETVSFAVEAFLVDGVAIWIAIAWLAVSTSRPTPEQRRATLVFTAIAVATAGTLVWPYLRDHLVGNRLSLGWLILGIGEAVVARHFLLEKDDVLRDGDFTMWYIIVFLFLWIVAMSVGMILYEM